EGNGHQFLDFGGDAGRKLIDDRMRKAERQVDLSALGFRAVADAVYLEHAGKALADALDHVGDQLAHEPVNGALFAGIAGALDDDFRVLDLGGEAGMKRELELALGALDLKRPAGDGSLDGLIEMNRQSSYPRHRSSPNPAEDFAAHFSAPRLASGHHAERGRYDLHAHRAPHLADLGGARVAPVARLADAVDAANHRFAGRRVTQFERQRLLGRFAGDFDAAEETFGHQHAANCFAQPRMGQREFIVPRAHRVADSRKQFSDRIGLRHNYWSLLPARLDHAGQLAVEREFAQAQAAHFEPPIVHARAA